MISLFDLYSIGIGPSSSHTVGPMRAAYVFCDNLKDDLFKISKIVVTLHGSLAHTGVGHGTNHAILYGLMGYEPDTIEPDQAESLVDQVLKSGQINLLGKHLIDFTIGEGLHFDYEVVLPEHSNGMRFQAYDNDDNLMVDQIIYSIGGGFIHFAGEAEVQPNNTTIEYPYPYASAAELLRHCEQSGLSIAGVQMANEMVLRSHDVIDEHILKLAEIMQACIDRGCHTEGLLNGKLAVRRRAPELYQKLLRNGKPGKQHPNMLNWVNVFAMAVNEENAASGRVVTAPTNGAAGIIPAVLAYYHHFHEDWSAESTRKFLLTAAAIGSLFKMNASISGAEMGCQGEVGVACSMAAGALAAVFGGTPKQVEQAAEIGIEHNLGLTCDPVDGLVQIPCIERNAMGAMKAINAAHIAMAESGDHKISLDMAINTMREIGENMNSIYKETSKGGLAVAVNVIEC
ncbi:MAG: L-serine ammonia-lyase [Coxiellaceae bacterium]|nr:L-serine ammonia-lyase [Coxiellaceae bacterium]